MSRSQNPATSPLVFSMRELARRPGAQRLVSASVAAPAVLGTDIVGVPAGAEVKLDLSFESVTEGIWVSGTATAQAVGECGRCLDEVAIDVAAPVQGLFVYPDRERFDDDEESESLLEFDGENIDVEGVVRDAVAVELPYTALCNPDCPGLCDQCGARLADDPDHQHQEIDPRWQALTGLTEQKES